ncbi:MAG: pyridoxal-dependent decarboxylase [Chloroflexota bacterium]|nr:pyridoxal-dependent decarboxylase [Chloroflexota bacterium]
MTEETSLDPSVTEETSLDPADWQAFRALGHRMVDDMVAFLAQVRQRPVWQPVPADVRARFAQPAPMDGQGAEQAYADFLVDVLPYPLGNIHPRFWGWVMGAGTPLGMLADLLAAGMNPNVGGRTHVANLVEEQVLAWLKELLDYPADASGLLVSGGSMANLIGLTAARNGRAVVDVRRRGVQATPGPMTLYASVETHSSVQRAVELLGLGHEALRRVPCRSDFRIDVAALERAIAADRAAGCHPFCVVGTAGTTPTGAIDDLGALAEVCARGGLWFHVDGTFGALAALSPSLRPLLDGMNRADSLAFDLHKWPGLPYDVGCILVRDAAAHRRAFAMTPDYLARAERGPAAGEHWFTDYGVELSRPFRALKVWLSLKAHGAEAFGRIIDQNVAQARDLASLVAAAPDLELLAPVALNVVCFRFVADGLDEAGLNRLNRELLLRLQEGGLALPSNATIGGRYGLRVAITNHRSRREDFDLLVREVQRLGRDLAGQGPDGVIAAPRGAESG